MMTSSLESKIDDLYQRPLDEFVPARAALASELKGDDARRVKQLKKPTNAPWAVNQVYWHARPAFDRVVKSGTALRRAQIAALEGRSADVRGASEAHRQAVSAAVAKAIEIARGENLHPSRDALTQTFEALSLASTPPESPGRLTQPLQPGGFEMLTAVEPVATTVRLKPDTTYGGLKPDTTPEKRREEAERKAAAAAKAREREAAAARRLREAAIKKAEGALARAREKEADAERAWRQAQEDVETARRARSLQS
jgi:hypothetical protein